jgi:hypothetical protein
MQQGLDHAKRSKTDEGGEKEELGGFCGDMRNEGERTLKCIRIIQV